MREICAQGITKEEFNKCDIVALFTVYAAETGLHVGVQDYDIASCVSHAPLCLDPRKAFIRAVKHLHGTLLFSGFRLFNSTPLGEADHYRTALKWQSTSVLSCSDHTNDSERNQHSSQQVALLLARCVAP